VIVSRRLQGDEGTIIQDAHRGATVPFAQLGEPQVDHAFAQGDALGLGAGMTQPPPSRRAHGFNRGDAL